MDVCETDGLVVTFVDGFFLGIKVGNSVRRDVGLDVGENFCLSSVGLKVGKELVVAASKNSCSAVI